MRVPMKNTRALRFLICLVLTSSTTLWAGTTGSISGTIKDPTGALVAGAMVTAINLAQGVQTRSVTDGNGQYTIPSLPVGRYDLQIEAQGFRSEKRTGLVIDADSALRADVSLALANVTERSEERRG